MTPTGPEIDESALIIVGNNYRMIIVGDRTAEVQRETYEHEFKTKARVFAAVKSTDEVIELLAANARSVTERSL